MTWCTRRIRLDWLRNSRGPWRVPARLVTPPSNGTPSMAMSTSAGLASGRRMKVGMPAKRGTLPESTGSKRVDILLFSLGLTEVFS